MIDTDLNLHSELIQRSSFHIKLPLGILETKSWTTPTILVDDTINDTADVMDENLVKAQTRAKQFDLPAGIVEPQVVVLYARRKVVGLPITLS